MGVALSFTHFNMYIVKIKIVSLMAYISERREYSIHSVMIEKVTYSFLHEMESMASQIGSTI